MAYSKTDILALVVKFNEKNETNYDTSWLICGKCEYWLASPIFIHQDEKHYCAKCSTELGGGIRIKAFETFLPKAQFPCINEKCPLWFTFENIQKHKGVCKFNVLVCNFCTDQCTEKEYLDHLIGSHSGNKIKITNSSLKIEFKNNSESKEKIIIGDYDSGTVVIHAKIEKELVYIGLASTQFDDTMKIETGHEYKLEESCDGIFGKTRLGKFISIQQFGNLKLYDVVPLGEDWKAVEINITLENHANLLTYADCPICMYPMKESIVLCENGHPVCSNCAPKMEKCALCRMTMNKVTLRLPDVIQNIHKPEKVDVKCGTSSKLAENTNKAETVAMRDSSMIKCPECNVEMTRNVVVDHFNQYHRDRMIENNSCISMDGYTNNKRIVYIIFDGNIFQLTFIWGLFHQAISVIILTSNDLNVAKRYHFEIASYDKNGLLDRIITSSKLDSGFFNLRSADMYAISVVKVY